MTTGHLRAHRVFLAPVLLMIALVACGGGSKELSAEEKRAQAIAEGNVALCNNGDFSNNTDFGKTCSGADGLDEWLAELDQRLLHQSSFFSNRPVILDLAPLSPTLAETAKVIAAACAYRDLMIRHIEREEATVFAAAEEGLPADRHGAILDGFERIVEEKLGAGEHRRLRDTLRRLQQVYVRE